ISLSLFSIYCSPAHYPLPSFPTRRSSDLPSSLALLFYMAGLRSLQQKYDEAEKIYRQILQQDPRSALARNNLAWLLAARDGKPRSEEHTSELQSRVDLVCRLLLEKKKALI